MSLQHQSVTIIGGYQLSDNVVFYTLLFTTPIICFMLMPASTWQHVLFLVSIVCDGIKAVWAVTTQEKVKELAALAFLLYILPNISLFHGFLMKTVKV